MIPGVSDGSPQIPVGCAGALGERRIGPVASWIVGALQGAVVSASWRTSSVLQFSKRAFECETTGRLHKNDWANRDR